MNICAPSTPFKRGRIAALILCSNLKSRSYVQKEYAPAALFRCVSSKHYSPTSPGVLLCLVPAPSLRPLGENKVVPRQALLSDFAEESLRILFALLGKEEKTHRGQRCVGWLCGVWSRGIFRTGNGFAVGGVVIVVVVSCPNADQGVLVAYAFGIVFILNVNLVV